MEDISVLQQRLLEHILLNSNSNASDNIEHQEESREIISEEHELMKHDLHLHQM